MGNRYYSERAITADRVELTGPEAHHLLHVMRAKRGDEVQVFDGSGGEFRCRVESLTRDRAALAVLSRSDICRELPHRVLLAVALPKADRARWIVEKATELGVTALIPLVTEYSSPPPAARQTRRWRRVVVEASKQCGRNRLMTVDDPCPWPRLVTQMGACLGHDARRVMADPGGPCHWHALPDPATETPPRDHVIAVGPEGGFSQAERQQATTCGWQIVRMGRRILRVETAALALAAWACRDAST